MSENFEVAITGISGRFPRCDDIVTFREMLYRGEEFVNDDESRWIKNYRYKYTDETVPKVAGKYLGMSHYDPSVFKVSRLFAECTDVINRKIMQPSFEAIVDAGINPYNLNNRNIGVYMACAFSDFETNALRENSHRLSLIGGSKTMMANRISFAFNFTGPSYTLYNDIFGNLQVLNIAYQNIKEGLVEAAVVGVSGVILSPTLSLNLKGLNFLDPDSLTRVFDENARGFGRTDGTVVLFLQRTKDAKRVYSTIEFSDTNYYGSNPNGILAFEEDLIKKCIIEMYSRHNYNIPENLAYVETSAGAIKRYDRIEANVIADIFCNERKTPLLVGSIKSNIGNTEAAAAFMGILKAIFAFETDKILPNRHIEKVNKNIRAFAENKLNVLTEETELSGNIIAVNSLSSNGYVGQAILKQNSKNQIIGGSIKDKFSRLIFICGRTEDGLRDRLKLLKNTAYNTDFIYLMNDVFSTDMPYHMFRAYAIMSPQAVELSQIETKGEKTRPIWFLFSGMGSQWNQMGYELLDVPIIAKVVEKCHNILKPHGIDIYKILKTTDSSIFDNIIHSFVGIITMQIALVEVLKVLNIEPDGIIGHSVGENACAYADGCLTLEQAVLASYARGVASLESNTIKGMMAAVGKGYNEIKNQLPPNIEVACHNSADNCTLSGPAEDLNNYVKHLQDEKIFAKSVNVSNIAYHSKYIAPAAPNLLNRLKKVIPKPKRRSSKWISTSVPESNWDDPLAETCSAEYLTNNLLNSVLFEEGCKHIPKGALIIEIAPHGLLQSIVKKSLPECSYVSLTRKSRTIKNMQHFLSGIGDLYLAGCQPNINAFYPSISFPVPRKTPSIGPFVDWNTEDYGEFYFVQMKDDGIKTHTDPITISIHEDSAFYYLEAHKISNQIIIPPSLLIYITWFSFAISLNIWDLNSLSVVFENIRIFKNLDISVFKPRMFTIWIQRGSGEFNVFKYNEKHPKKDTLVMSGKITANENEPSFKTKEILINENRSVITGQRFYQLLRSVGYQLSNEFLNVQEIVHDEFDYNSTIKWNGNWVAFLDGLFKSVMYSKIKNNKALLCVSKIRRIEISAKTISLLKKDSPIACNYNLGANTLYTNECKIDGIEFDEYSIKSKYSNFQLEGLHFVSHKNPRCSNVSKFFKLSLQIAIENLPTMLKRSNNKLFVVDDTNNGKELKIIEELVKENDLIKSKTTICQKKDILSRKLDPIDNCFLVIMNGFQDIRIFSGDALFLLVIAASTEDSVPQVFKNSFITISKQPFGAKTCYFFKKVPTMNGYNLSISMDNENWSEICELEKKSNPTFIIRKSIESSDLSTILSNKKSFNDPRYLFVMDNEEKQTETLIRNQILEDLPVAVLRNGEWGSYRNIEDKIISKNPQKVNETLPIDFRLKSIQIQYFSHDGKPEVENEITKYGIEYAGIHDSGDKIMGLAMVHGFEPTMTEPDPLFSWKVPKNWTMEDAVTVPLCYAQAYYILSKIESNSIRNRVLISVGKEGYLAEACIRISLSSKLDLYLIVADENESKIVKKKFPTIKHTQIITREKDDYEKQILLLSATKKINMVINYKPNSKQRDALLRVIGLFGHYIEINEENRSTFDTLGLEPFINNLSIKSIFCKVSLFTKMGIEQKSIIKLAVEEGIKNGVVVPFDRLVQIQGMPIDIPESTEMRYIKIINKYSQGIEIYNFSQRLRYSSNCSYIIIGEEKKDNSWFELLDWLIKKGAKKFIIAIKNFTADLKISHHINRLLNQKKATIVSTSSQKVNTIQESLQLINEADKIAPLEAVFFLCMEQGSKKIHNMSAALQTKHPNTHLISIFSGGLEECESRRYQGSPAVVIHGEKIFKFSAVLPYIDNILSEFDNSNSPTLYKIVETGSKENTNSSLTLRNHIPRNLQTLEEIGQNIPEHLEFLEVATLSPKYSEVKGQSPIFIIPALHGTTLKPLFSKLMYPTFCANIPNQIYSLQEMVQKLYQSIVKIQPVGGVTLVVENWQYPLAFELSNLLEQNERKRHLFLLEANPLKWKNYLKQFGPVDSIQFENNILSQIFDIDSKSHPNSLSDSTQPLNEKFKKYLSKLNYDEPKIHNISKLIGLLHFGLTIATKYEYENSLLQNTIVFSKNIVDEEILKYSKTSEFVLCQADDYNNFIEHPLMAQKINANVLYNVWN